MKKHIIHYLIAVATLLFTSYNSLSGQAKVNSSTFGALEARALGPGTMSGRITAIEGVNNEPKTIYVGTAGGGIWKSTNAGASYKSIFDKYCQSIGDIAIDQKNPSTIYVGTGESNMRNTVSIGMGIYKTTDAGENWTKIGLDSTEHISKIIINPTNSDILYAAAPGPLWSDSPHRGLYKSTDAGKTWQKIFFISDKTGCADIAMNPKNPEILYASMWQFRRKPYSFESGGPESGLYKSIDGGKNWTPIRKGLPEGDLGRIALALAPSEPDKLLAIVEAKETGLYISSDGGLNWKVQSATMNVTSRPFYFSTLEFDPFDANRVYRPAFTFSYSDDGGLSFADVSNDGGWVHPDHHALWINPKNTNQMFLGTDGGVYISNDRGATFMFCHNLPVGQFYHVAVDNDEPYNLYGGLQDNGSWIAPSAYPGGVGNGEWKSVYWGDGFWTVPDPTDDGIIYAEYQGGNMARIEKKGMIPNSIKPQKTEDQEKLRWNWNTPIHLGNKNPKNLYVGAQYLYKSNDQGRNWKCISPDLTTNDKKKQEQEKSGGLSADNTSAENHCTIYYIAESPLDENIIWVGTDDGNIQVSSDGGKKWNNVANNYAKSGIPAQTWVSSISPSNFDKNTVYATFDRHAYGDHKTYAAVSNDMGKTWTQFSSSEFTGYANIIKEDLVNKNLLFLGTEYGLFTSLDGGQNWFRMKNKIPDYAMVRDIQIHKRDNALIVATHGRGIYIIDDINPMRSMTNELMEKEVVLFDQGKITLTTGKYAIGSPISGGWTAGNPDEIPPIMYYLKDRVVSGDVNIEVYDEQNNLIQSIPGTKRKGLNKVYWNQRMKPPKVAEGGTKLDFGGFAAPQVLPGKYKIKLTVAGKEYSDDVEMVHQDKPNYTIDDRKLQHEVSMKYYKMHEELAATVERINNEQKLINEHKSKLTKEENKNYADTYFKKLESLRNELLASETKSMFADEEKLRERISDAYGSVVDGENRPSNLLIDRATSLNKEQIKSKEDQQKIDKDMGTKMRKIWEEEKIIVPNKAN